MRIEDAPFSRFVTVFLTGGLIYGDKINGFYLKHVNFINYLFVCFGLGVLINYIAYHILVMGVWEPLAFWMGVGVAGLSNFTLTRGPLCYLFFGKEAKP